MGIYDREYIRREGPGFLGSLAASGKVCKWLIVINVGVFVLQLLAQPHEQELRMTDEGIVVQEPARNLVTDTFELDAPKVLHGEVWRLLTYAFLHGGLWHIFFNMLFLWWFGKDVEDVYGHKEFLAFYLVSAVIGGLAFQLAWMLGLSRAALSLGASGAVMAVLVMCALHFPRRIIYLFMFLPVPIWVFVLFEVGQDFFTFMGQYETGTAVTVHLGGAAFAFLYYKSHWRMMNLTNLWPSLWSWQRLRSRPPLRVYREDQPASEAASGTAPSPAAEADEHLEAKVDAVLEKVARQGQASLTESERQILLRASEVYKKRRT